MATADTVPAGTIPDVLAWVGNDPARARAALDAERDGANRSSLINQLEPIAAREEEPMSESTELAPPPEETGIVEDDEGREPYPEGNAPGPLPPNVEDIEIDPRDRAVWVGPANARHTDVELPEDRYDLAAAADADDEDVALGPEPGTVDFFQVMSLGGAVIIRTDDQALLLDRDQSAALSRDLRQALANVTY